MQKLVQRKGWVAAAVLGIAAAVGAGAGGLSLVTGEEPRPKQVDAAAKSSALELSKAFRSAAAIATPSVVKIRSHTSSKPVARAVPRPGGRGGDNPFKGTPFEDFFNDGDGPARRSPQRDGVGSGVIIDRAGIVLTNNHVVEGADSVIVRLSDGREFKATDIKTDPQTDLAVLRIKADGDLPAVKLGNSDDLEIGDWVIAIGNPFELEQTVSAGIISGKGRELGSVRRAKFLQTDAAINPGNSGGPLVNLDGEVVGINTAIASNSGGYQGIGFAIPANLAKWITDQLISKGSVQRGYLGVGIEEVSSDLAQKFGVRRGEGVLISEVFPDSPASEAGLKDGDVITNFGGKAVKTPRDLQEIVERSTLNKGQKITVQRDGKPVELTIAVKPLPDQFGAARPAARERDQGGRDTFHAEKLGFEVAMATGEDAKREGVSETSGVVITKVDEDGPAAAKGLRPGMIIRKVGKTTIEDLASFREAVKGESLKDGVLLQVRTPNGNRFVVLQEVDE